MGLRNFFSVSIGMFQLALQTGTNVDQAQTSILRMRVTISHGLKCPLEPTMRKTGVISGRILQSNYTQIYNQNMET